MANVLVLGAGVWGTAIASHLTNRHKVSVWSYRNDEIESLNRGIHKNLSQSFSNKINFFHSDIRDISNDYEYIFVALPFQKIRENLERIDSNNLKNKKYVILSKGIEIERHKTGREILKEIGIKRVATLYGPTHSDGILNKEYSSMVCSSEDMRYNEDIKSMFETNYLKVYCNTNVVLADYVAAMKNSGAIAYGIAEGLGLGLNTKASILSEIAMDIRKIVEKLGSNIEDVVLPNGIGDMYITALKGRNRSFGEALGKNKKTDSNMVVEGFATTKAIFHLSQTLGVELKLHNLLYSILYKSLESNRLLDIFKGELT